MSTFEEELMAPVPKKRRKAGKKPRHPSEINDADLAGLVNVPVVSILRQTSPVQAPEEPTMFDPEVFRRRADIKVFSGRRTTCKVPSLVALCQRSLSANFNVIAFGEASVELLRPVLSQCTPQQLERVQRNNPNNSHCLDEFWDLQLSKQYKVDASDPQIRRWRALELSWSKIFERLGKLREKRLQNVALRIERRRREAKATAHRTKMLELKKHPPFVPKRQLLPHRMYFQIPVDLPARFRPPESVKISSATAPYTSTATVESPLPAVVEEVNLPSSSSKSGGRKIAKPKVAPLMAKSLRMMKNLRR